MKVPYFYCYEPLNKDISSFKSIHVGFPAAQNTCERYNKFAFYLPTIQSPNIQTSEISEKTILTAW